MIFCRLNLHLWLSSWKCRICHKNNFIFSSVLLFSMHKWNFKWQEAPSLNSSTYKSNVYTYKFIAFLLKVCSCCLQCQLSCKLLEAIKTGMAIFFRNFSKNYASLLYLSFYFFKFHLNRIILFRSNCFQGIFSCRIF